MAKPLFALVLSSVVTFLAVSLDQARREEHHHGLGVRLARQLASQLEALIVSGREQEEIDPVGWALTRLSQGAEPRIVFLSRIELDPELPAEQMNWDEKSGTLDYRKVLLREEGQGARWEVRLGYLGFLGARSRFVSELYALILFSAVFLVLGLLLGVFPRKMAALEKAAPETAPLPVPVLPAEETLRRTWSGDLTPHLEGLKRALESGSVHLRDVLRAVHSMLAGAGEAHSSLRDLRERMQKGVGEIHEGRRWLKSAGAVGAQLESATLNLVLEMQRNSQGNERVSELADRLHRIAREHRRHILACEAAMGRVELELEPWSADSDQAFQAIDGVMEQSAILQGELRPTTESLVAQANSLHELEQAVRAEILGSAQKAS